MEGRQEGKILVVEDEGIIAADIKNTLTNLGYTVTGVFSSGEAAIESAKETRPDLVLMDIVLKGAMDGVEAAEAIRQRWGIPVVFLTAYADERILQKAKTAGPFGYLLKPFEERELRSTIEIALYRRQMEMKLQKGAEEWEGTFNSIQDWISIHDRNSRIVRVNHSLAKAFNMPSTEMEGKLCHEIFHRGDTFSVQCSHCRAWKNQGAYKEEFFETALGIYLEISCSPIFNQRGEIEGTVHIAQDISDRKKQETVLQESEARANKLAEIGRIIGSSLSIDEVYLRFSEEVKKLVSYDWLDISLLSEEGNSFICRRMEGDPVAGREPGNVYPIGGTIGEAAIRTRKGVIFYVENEKEALARYPGLLPNIRAGARTFLSIPLISRNQVIGLLRFRSKKERAYLGTDLKLAESIGNQIAGWVANSQIYMRMQRAEQTALRSQEQAKRLAAENGVLAEIGRIISSTFNIEEVFKLFSAEVKKLIPFDWVSISLVNQEENTFTTRYIEGDIIPERRKGAVYSIAGTLGEPAVRSRQAIAFSVENEEEALARYPGLLPNIRAGAKSFMVIPLISGDKVIGLLRIRSKKDKAYLDRELEVAERIGHQIAEALVNSLYLDQWVQAEERLRRSEEHFRSLIENSSDVITTIDRRLRISYISSSVERILGSKAEDYIHREIGEFIHPEDSCIIADKLTHLFKNAGAPTGLEHRLKRQDGSWGFFYSIGKVILDNFGNPLVIVNSRDISEQKHLETQLVQAQKLEAVGQLAAGIAHEINTPIQYVGDNTEFLKESFKGLEGLLQQYGELLWTLEGKGEQESLVQTLRAAMDKIDLPYLRNEIPKAIEQALEGVGRVAKIVRAMKEFSHPGGKEKTLADINKAIENTITVSRNEWKYVAEMVTDLDSSLPPVPCLVAEFSQVILNIIINAAHAIADVAGERENGKGTIKISTRHDPNGVEIRISDTGTGIPEGIRSKVFDPFFTTKQVGKGTGQGLTIAYSIVVKKHGGTIDFETEPGQGTTFIVRLPLAKGPEGQ